MVNLNILNVHYCIEFKLISILVVMKITKVIFKQGKLECTQICMGS
jgi:hypothetical protein